MFWLAVILLFVTCFVLPQDSGWVMVVGTSAFVLLAYLCIVWAFRWVGGPSTRDKTLSELLGVKPDDHNHIFPF